MARTVFISFADDDRKFRDALVTHLAPMIRTGKIRITDSDTGEYAGTKKDQRLAAIDAADLVVLLLSARFLGLEETQDDLVLAEHRSTRERTPVVPILLRPCDLRDTWLDGRRILGEDKPLESPSNDAAWTKVVEVIRAELAKLPPEPAVQPTGKDETRDSAPTAAPERGAPPWLSGDDLRRLSTAAIQCRLERGVLMSGLPPELVANVQVTATNVAGGLLADLNVLNELHPLPDGQPPLAVWLKNAIHLSAYRMESKVFEAALARLASSKRSV